MNNEDIQIKESKYHKKHDAKIEKEESIKKI
jgi:hypothetical protein